jgi:hypothetical protein
MIEKFGKVRANFLDRTHTRKTIIPISLVMAAFARKPRLEHTQSSQSGH